MSATVPAPPSLQADPKNGTPLLTAEEFFARYQARRAELIRGVVQELPMPDALHGRVCVRIGRYLDEFAEKHDLGRVMGNDSFVKVRENPDTIRGADVYFISYQRLPKGDIPTGILDEVPEVVVEIRSPSEAWTELITKVLEYLTAGVRAVVVINPVRKAVAVYRSDNDEEHFSNEQDLIIPDVLPGFSVPVKKLFE